MTDSAIRTEVDLRAAMQKQRDLADLATVARRISKLADLGFGILDIVDWSVADPAFTAGTGISRFRLDATRYADTPDAHTAPAMTSSFRPYCCRIQAHGPTLPDALASLLSEARTKAAPK